MSPAGQVSDFRGNGIPTKGPASGLIRHGLGREQGVRFSPGLAAIRVRAVRGCGNREGSAIGTIGIDTMANVSPFKFLQEVRQEVAKITWPSRRETMVTTAMVFVFAAAAAVFFLMADQVIRMTVTLVLGIGS